MRRSADGGGPPRRRPAYRLPSTYRPEAVTRNRPAPRRAPLRAAPPSAPARTTEKRSSPSVRAWRRAHPRLGWSGRPLSLADIGAIHALTRAQRQGSPRLVTGSGRIVGGSPLSLLAGYLRDPRARILAAPTPRPERVGNAPIKASDYTTPGSFPHSAFTYRAPHAGVLDAARWLAQAGQDVGDFAFPAKTSKGRATAEAAVLGTLPGIGPTLALTGRKVARNTARDLVNIPAQAPLSIAETVKAAAAALGGNLKPAEGLAKGYWDTGFLPALAQGAVKGDFSEAAKRAEAHPVGAGLELSAAGGVLSKFARAGLIGRDIAVGGTKAGEYLSPRTRREVPIVPGLAPTASKPLSRNPFAHAFQIAAERRRARRGEAPLPRRTGKSQRAERQRLIRRHVDFQVDQNEVVRRARGAAMEKLVHRALRGGRFGRSAKFMAGHEHVAHLLLEGRLPLTSEAAARSSLREIRARLVDERQRLAPGDAAKTNDAVVREIDAALAHPTVLRDLPRIAEQIGEIGRALNQYDAEAVAAGYLDPARVKARLAPHVDELMGGRPGGLADRVLTDVGQARRALRAEARAAGVASRAAVRDVRDALAEQSRARGEVVGRQGALREAGMSEAEVAARLHERTRSALTRAVARRERYRRDAADESLPERERRFAEHRMSRENDTIDRLEARVHEHEGRDYMAATAEEHRLTVDRLRRANAALAAVRREDPATPEGQATVRELEALRDEAQRHADELDKRALDAGHRVNGSNSELADYLRSHADTLMGQAARARAYVEKLAASVQRARDPFAHAERVAAAERKAAAAQAEAEAAAHARVAHARNAEIAARDAASAKLREARAAATEAKRAEREAKARAAEHKRETRGQRQQRTPWRVGPNGEEITPAMVEASMRSHGIDPSGVAYLSQAPGVTQAASHYRTMEKPGSIGGAKTRSGSATRKGLYDISLDSLLDRIANRVTTAELVAATDRLWREWTFGSFKSFDGAKRAIDALAYESLDAEGNTLRYVDGPDGGGYVRQDGTPAQAAETRVRPWAHKPGAEGQDMFTAVNLAPLFAKLREVERIRDRLDPAAFDDVAAQLSQATSLITKPGRGRGEWTIVPTDLVEWIDRHYSKAAASGDWGKAFQVFTHQFRQTVLLTSTKWFTGNVVEMLLRTVLTHGMGPRAWMTGRKLEAAIKAAEDRGEIPAGTLERFQASYKGGAHYGMLGRHGLRRGPRQFSGTGFRRASDIAYTALHEGGIKNPVHDLHSLWDAYRYVIRGLNEYIEKQGQVAALGWHARREYRQFGEKWENAILLSKGAYEDLARGLGDTSRQHAYARAVDDVIGQYSKFSPGTRAAVQGMGLAPFLAWFRNALKFVYVTLPKEHPVKTGILAGLYESLDEKITKQGFDALNIDPNKIDPYLQGGVMLKDGRVVRIAHFTPFAIASEGIAGLPDLLLPQLNAIGHGIAGKTFSGAPIVNAQGKPTGGGIQNLGFVMNALAEQMVPGLALVRQIQEGGGDTHPTSRAWAPRVKGASKASGGAGRSVAVAPKGSLGTGALKAFDPFYPAKTKRSRAAAERTGPTQIERDLGVTGGSAPISGAEADRLFGR